MTRIPTIFRKEFLDTIRDRRTLIMMIVVPLLVVPALISLVAAVGRRQSEKAEEELSNVAFVGQAYAPELYGRFMADSQFVVLSQIGPGDIERLIRDDSLDGAIVVPPEFSRRIQDDRQAAVQLYYQSSNQLNVTERRMREVVEAYDSSVVSGRIRRFELDENLFDAVEINTVDVSSLQERFGKTVGGFLPYMFIIFCFTGAMYPGIDLGAGEKERGTLETILSSPARRLEIVLGKFFVVSLIGLASAMVSMLGLYLGFRSVSDVPEEIMTVVWDILNPQIIGMIASLLIPLAAFFAAAILAISINAKSFKEAQSSLVPMNFIVIVPVLIGLMPGIELSPVTALVPILNVSLATKEVIAGTIDPFQLTLVYLSLFVLAGLSIWFCVKWFNREETLFRT